MAAAPKLHLDKAPDKHRAGRAAERRQAVRQLLPELPRRQLHALQPLQNIGLSEQRSRTT
jgi:hypothetical protein